MHLYPRNKILAYIYLLLETQQVVLKNAVSLKAALYINKVKHKVNNIIKVLKFAIS